MTGLCRPRSSRRATTSSASRRIATRCHCTMRFINTERSSRGDRFRAHIRPIDDRRGEGQRFGECGGHAAARCGEGMPRRRDGMAVACKKQRRHGRRTPAQAGFSLAEVTVTLAVVSALMLIVYSIMDQTLRASMFNESHNDLIIMSQRAMNTMQSETVQARQVFEENADGQAYRAALQVPALYPAWSPALLPIVQSDSTMAPDTT